MDEKINASTSTQEDGQNVRGADSEARLATTAACADQVPAAGQPAARKLTGRQKAVAGVVAAVSVALIGVSACFLFAPAQAGSGAALKSTAEPAESASEQPAASAAEPDASTAEADAPAVDETSAAATGSGADSGDGGGVAPVPAGSEASSAQGGSGSSEASEPSGGSQQPATVTVSVAVSSSAADGRVSGGANPTFAQGATVYDALMACGLSVNASPSPYGIYVSAIGGLAEKEFGGASGWVYTVNGNRIDMSCSKYVLQDGDAVSWFYVV